MAISTNSSTAKASTGVVGNATANGTPIVKPGADLDKNAFFKILAAELSNQDPTQAQDTTAYISQLAQFTSLEQMTSLNNTMTLSAAQNLTGKFVALDVLDSKGIPECGVVRAVYKYSGDVYVTVEGVDGKLKDYTYSQVTDVLDSGDPNMDNLTFSNATTLIGKNVTIADTGDTEDSEEEKVKNIEGKVLEVYRDGQGIKLKVEGEVDGKKEVKDYLFDLVISVKN